MSDPSRETRVDAHRRASEEFRNLGLDEQRERMRAAGVLGVTPRLGDKVRAPGRLHTWRYGVVVGADEGGHGRVHVAHDDGRGVRVEPLDVFAGGRRVELVQRASQGREYDVAASVMGRRGQRFDIESFDVTAVSPPQASSSGGEAILGGLLAAVGLAALAVVLSDDKTWDERAGRYRDARAKPATG